MLPHRGNRIVAAALLVLLLTTFIWYAYRGETRVAAGTEHDYARELPRADPASPPGNDARGRLQESPMPYANADPRSMDGRTNTSRSLVSPASDGRASTQSPLIAPDASASLADALQRGDDRAPPIEYTTDNSPAPTPNELAAPAAYLRYQSRQQARLHASFEQHALIALSDMQRDLQRARAEHLPPELIAEGDEKMQKLAETLNRLHRQELDSAHQSRRN